MPTFKSADLEMHYVVDDFTDPWTKPETIVLLHGNAESSLAWYGWVPHLARRYRVVRPDRRGFGASTPMPRNFEWSFDVLIDDHIRLMDVTTEGSGLASIEENRAWQERIPSSRLVVLPGDSYHVALTDPDACAKATLDFITQQSSAL
jgi:pimeloyl-ACP methyl ester carboxylesterase